MIYRIFIGGRELDIQAPGIEDALAAAAAQYPGERITGFYPVPEETEHENERLEGPNNGD